MESVLMQEALERFETIWANVECGVSIIDAETREIVDINPEAVRMFEGDKADIVGQRCHKFICPAEEHSCPIMDKNQVVDRSERTFIKANGEMLPIIKSVAKISYKGRTMLLESFIDISNLKNAEEQLRLLSITERANQAKSDFLSRMSHEMRTPLTAIIGMAKIAETTDDTDRLKYCLSTIGHSATHLSGIINDILDMSKIEAGKFELYIAVLDLEEAFNNACNLLRGQAEEKGIKLDASIDLKAKRDYLGDELRLSQVMTNLLSNAVKFTPENESISFVVEEVEQKDNSSVLRFTVADTGIGMTEEQRSRLFKAFEQADTSITRRFGGTGLGLAISKSIIDMMGGRIWVESEIDKGSTFSFEIELEHACPVPLNTLRDERAVSEVPDLSHITVLLAEDTEINREIFIVLLESTGLNIVTAENGLKAVEKFMQNPDSYDIIIMDVHMPEMNGLEATKAIRAMDLDRAKTVPIIAMTADVFREDIDKCLACGMNDHLGKPIDYSAVVEKISTYAGVPCDTVA